MSETTEGRAIDDVDGHECVRVEAFIERTRERDALAQAIHDARGILGFDNDGDKEPHTNDYFQYAEFHRRDMAEVRKDHDEALAETDQILAARFWLEGHNACCEIQHQDEHMAHVAGEGNPYSG